MGAFYLFAIWSVVPLVPAPARYQTAIPCVPASVAQLVALPPLMQGNVVLSQHSDDRAEVDHRTTMREIRGPHGGMRTLIDDLRLRATEIHRINVGQPLRGQAGRTR